MEGDRDRRANVTEGGANLEGVLAGDRLPGGGRGVEGGEEARSEGERDRRGGLADLQEHLEHEPRMKELRMRRRGSRMEGKEEANIERERETTKNVGELTFSKLASCIGGSSATAG